MRADAAVFVQSDGDAAQQAATAGAVRWLRSWGATLYGSCAQGLAAEDEQGARALLL